MADTALHSLTQATSLAATDELYKVQSPFGSGDDRRFTVAVLTAFLATATLAAGTITTSQPLTLTQTWNAGGVTFNALLVNVTATASAATSRFLSLQIAGVDKFYIKKDGSTYMADGTFFGNASNNGFELFSSSYIGWATGALDAGNTIDLKLTRKTTATLQLGAADAATAVAQTFGVQSIIAGTSNIAGADWTLVGSIGTGTGAGGQFVFRTAPAGSTGTAQNALATALTLTAPAVNMQPSVVVGNQALATTATDGFIYIPGGAGPPSGVPTAFTGRVPLYYDSTNDQFYIYRSGWKQPKTPAGAAIVSWQ